MSADNPFDSPDLWGAVLLSGRALPGIILSVDGAIRPYEWQISKGIGSTGATSTFRGEGLAESIKIVLAAHKRSDFADLASMRKYIAPRKGVRPPSFAVKNPIINFNEINKVSIKEIGQPKYAGKGCYWTLELEFLEYRPPVPITPGPAEPAKIPNDPQPKDAAEATMQALLKQIAAVG